MISLHYTSHTKAYNTIYTACNIAEAIYSFTFSYMLFAIYNDNSTRAPCRLLFRRLPPM